MAPTHVLVALDGSPLADEALAHALAVYECQLTVLNIVTPLDAGMAEGGVLMADENRKEAAEARAERLIERAEAQATAADRAVETTVRSGDPAETIIEYANANDIDHIVMGSHGSERGAVARRLLGTVSTDVIGEAPVSVTVIR